MSCDIMYSTCVPVDIGQQVQCQPDYLMQIMDWIKLERPNQIRAVQPTACYLIIC